MQLILWAAIVVFSVVLDQITKYIVVMNLKPIGSSAFIDGLLGFRYVENTGAAFGMMKGFRWGFIIISTIAITALAIYLVKYRKEIPAFLGITLSMIIGGGIGNQIDRIVNGFVVDFFEFQFIDFAVFNVADCFVTVGAFLAVIDLIFIDREFLLGDKEKSKKSENDSGEIKS